MMLRNAAAVVLTLLFANTALALDGIELSNPPQAVGEGECPLLVQIKYPFMTCAGADASKVVNAPPTDTNRVWNEVRQIPLMSIWTESDGYWGPDLHQN